MDSPLNKVIAAVMLILGVMSGWAYYLIPHPSHDGKIPLDWYTAYNVSRDETVSTFNRVHTEFNLKQSRFRSDRKTLQQLIVQCSSGVGPDVFDINGGSMLEYCIATGIAWDITDYADKYGIGKEAMRSNTVSDVCVDGRQYGYPTSGGPSVLVYNKNVFDEFNVPYPKADLTWDELVEIAKKVTRISANPNDSLYGVQGFAWAMFLASFQGEFFSEDGSRILAESEPMEKAFQMHMDFRFKHHITPSQLDLKSMSSQGGFSVSARDLYLLAEGKLAMLSVGQWSIFEFRRIQEKIIKDHQKWEANPNRDPAKEPRLLRFGSIMHPHAPGSPVYFRAGGRTTVINALSPHREKALTFLRYLTSREQCHIANASGEMPPGNPLYGNEGFEVKYPAIAEAEIHENTLLSLERCYSFRRSPFLLTLDVERVLSDQIDRLESDPTLQVGDVLKEAQLELERLMQKNIDRVPELRIKYKALTGLTDVHEAHLKGSSEKSVQRGVPARFAKN